MQVGIIWGNASGHYMGNEAVIIMAYLLIIIRFLLQYLNSYVCIYYAIKAVVQ